MLLSGWAGRKGSIVANVSDTEPDQSTPEQNDETPMIVAIGASAGGVQALQILFETLPGDQHRALWGVQEFYRAFSLVNGGRNGESDLFEGLR